MVWRCFFSTLADWRPPGCALDWEAAATEFEPSLRPDIVAFVTRLLVLRTGPPTLGYRKDVTGLDALIVEIDWDFFLKIIIN